MARLDLDVYKNGYEPLSRDDLSLARIMGDRPTPAHERVSTARVVTYRGGKLVTRRA